MLSRLAVGVYVAIGLQPVFQEVELPGRVGNLDARLTESELKHLQTAHKSARMPPRGQLQQAVDGGIMRE